MAVDTEQTLDRTDMMKLAGMAGVLLLSLVGFYSFEDSALLYRVIGLLVGFGVAIALFLASLPGRRLNNFMRLVRTEVRRVVWPTRQETLQTTLMVSVIVLLVGIFIWILDGLCGWIFQLVSGIGG